MRILFTRFPLESAKGGAERQTLALMRGLRDRGHEVAFLGSCPVLLQWCKEVGITATELQIGPPPVTKWSAVSFAWRQFAMRKQLAAHCSRLDVDAVFMLSLSEKLLLTPLLAAHDSPPRMFWLEHDPVSRWFTHNPWLPRLRVLSREVMTVTVSALSRKIYIELGWDPQATVAIANGIDVGGREWGVGSRGRGTELPISQFPIPYSLLPTPKYHIGTVARLAREKGIDILLRSVEHLPNTELYIAGTGPEEKDLRALAAEMDIAERVHFVRRIEDIGAFYRSLDVFVLPSRTHDPFGLAAAEAMAAGVPTVVTDACGIAAHLRDDEALVVPSNSPGALSEAILKLGNAELRTRMGSAGAQAIRARFTAEQMVDAYVQLFLQHTAKNRSPKKG
ncbi:MAG: glycosyltransferase family 4 protein [Candidatus Peribacteraceae bacterium]